MNMIVNTLLILIVTFLLLPDNAQAQDDNVRELIVSRDCFYPLRHLKLNNGKWSAVLKIQDNYSIVNDSATLALLRSEWVFKRDTFINRNLPDNPVNSICIFHNQALIALFNFQTLHLSKSRLPVKSSKSLYINQLSNNSACFSYNVPAFPDSFLRYFKPLDKFKMPISNSHRFYQVIDSLRKFKNVLVEFRDYKTQLGINRNYIGQITEMKPFIHIPYPTDKFEGYFTINVNFQRNRKWGTKERDIVRSQIIANKIPQNRFRISIDEREKKRLVCKIYATEADYKKIAAMKFSIRGSVEISVNPFKRLPWDLIYFTYK